MPAGTDAYANHLNARSHPTLALSFLVAFCISFRASAIAFRSPAVTPPLNNCNCERIASGVGLFVAEAHA
jgi:hypothetical protein